MSAVTMHRAERRRQAREAARSDRPEPAQRAQAPTMSPAMLRRLRRMRASRPYGKRQLGRKVEAHTRTGPERDSGGRPVTWHETRPLPWRSRQDNRRRGKAARAARRASR